MSEIAIIIPVYNVEKYLCRCLDSILSQTVQAFTVVLVDDGSTDNSGKICDNYSSDNKRIVVIHKPNGGLSSARNAGLDWVSEHTEIEWVTLIDSDDFVSSDYLEQLISAAEFYHTEISVCGFERTENNFISGSNNEEQKTEKIEVADFYRNYGVNATVAWGKLYKLSLFNEIRYPVGKLHEDEFVTYRLLFQTDYIAYVNKKLYAYFINNSGIMANWNPKRLDSLDAIKERMKYFAANGYNDLVEEHHKTYVWNLVNHIKAIKATGNSKYLKYLIRLRHELRLKLLQYRSQIKFRSNKWLYEEAYPIPMLVYWNACSRIKKFRQALKGNKGNADV